MLAAVLLFPVKTNAISAQKAVLLDTVSGRALFSQRADEKSLIASTTKIMTALIVCEQCNVLDRMVIPPEATNIEGSSMYLQAGEILTVQELLYGLMLSSGNDAAVALAIYCAGNVPGFVDLMNDKARMLEMKNTHFANPNGLDAVEHYSTAHDLAILAAYAMENPIFAKTVSTKTTKVGERYLRNHNKLLWLYDGTDGVKTGYTKAAGRILVSSAVRKNRRLIAVSINAPDDWNDHRVLLDRGFEEYHVKKLVSAGERLGSVSILGGELPSAELIAGQDFSYAVAEDEHPSFVKCGKDFAAAPIVESGDAGFVYVVLSGKAVGKIPVVYGQTIEISQPNKKLPFGIGKRKPNARTNSKDNISPWSGIQKNR